MNRIRSSYALVLALLGLITVSILTFAQAPATGPVMRLSATTANVSGAPDNVRFDVLSWSTDADRDQLVAAWNMTARPAAPAAAAGRGAEGRGGGGAGRGGGGGRGGDAAAGAGNAPPAADAGAGGAAAGGAAGGAAAGAAAAGGGGGRGGRGGGGGGGRGGGAPAAADAARTPESSLAAALQAGKTVGYLWTSESAGYSLRYAYKTTQPDGSDRIVFVTERRLGAWNDLWKPAANATATNYEFTVIELHVPAKLDGEGKTSLTGKVTVDPATKSIALDGYATLPVVFKAVKRRTN